MSPITLGFIFLITFAFTEVAAWTIDLPLARKYYFEKSEKVDEITSKFNENGAFFDNIVPDSPHNRHELEDHDHHHSSNENDVYGEKYAEDYEYLSYMEKKVHNIVHNGSIYLEGLRRALEDYGQLLQNCTRMNFTQARPSNGPWLPENDRPLPQESGNSTFGDGNSQMNQPSFNIFNQSEVNADTCERATRASEHVRRLSELALWATRELQDRAYAKKFDKQSHDEEEEEAELLLRLAFFLDRLAAATGYEPRPRDYLDRSSTTTTSPPPPPPPPPPASAMGAVGDDTKRRMMDCISADSTDPRKCDYPQIQPEIIRRIFNITESPEAVQPVSTERYQPRDPSYREVFMNPVAQFRRQKREITINDEEKGSETLIDQEESPTLLATAFLTKKLAHKVGELHEDRSFDKLPEYPHRSGLIERIIALRHSRRKLIEKLAEFSRPPPEEKEEEKFEFGFGKREVRNKRNRRSADDPALEFLKYYAKHQVWANSNPSVGDTKGNFDVSNKLPILKPDEYQTSNVRRLKRAIGKKNEHLRLPEDPFQDLSNIVKHGSGVNYIKDENEIEKTRQYLDKLRNSSSATSKLYAKKLLKKVHKRSVKYGRKFLPSRSQNPRQDISYYVKNKEGTDYKPNLVQAAQVRSNLEFIFQNPNIEVVRRYGANYNPAIPFPLGFGIANSFFTDI